MFGSIGFTELILILFIVLIIFGAGKLPQLGEGLGKAIKGFKKSVHEADAIEAEAQAQAICMQTEDFVRAYHAFVARQKPQFEGN
jgi:sec-independent protein translocase protein TatA